MPYVKKQREALINSHQVLNELNQIKLDEHPTLRQFAALIRRYPHVAIHIPAQREQERELSEIFSIIDQFQTVEVSVLGKETGQDEEMLTVEETAELLQVSKPAVYKWIRNRQIDFVEPAVQKGYLIPKGQFKERLEKMESYKHKFISVDHVAESYTQTLQDGSDSDLPHRQDLYHEKPEENDR